MKRIPIFATLMLTLIFLLAIPKEAEAQGPNYKRVLDNKTTTNSAGDTTNWFTHQDANLRLFWYGNQLNDSIASDLYYQAAFGDSAITSWILIDSVKARVTKQKVVQLAGTKVRFRQISRSAGNSAWAANLPKLTLIADLRTTGR